MSENSIPEEGRSLRLDVYVNNERLISGMAKIVGNDIKAYLDDFPETQTLECLAKQGIINSVSVIFNAPPAVPVYDEAKNRNRFIENFDSYPAFRNSFENYEQRS